MNLTLPPRPRNIRPLLAEEAAALREEYKESPKLIPTSPKGCLTCDGTKTFQWYGPDGSIATYDCPCDDQWIMSRYFLYHGIPLVYQTLGWRDVSFLPDTTNNIIEYMTNAEMHFRYGEGLYLYGSNGTGKTVMGTLVLRHFMVLGYRCQFYTFRKLLSLFSDSGHAFSSLNRAKNIEILMLDDPGKEGSFGAKSTEYAVTILDDVFRHRVSMGLPTIFASNFTEAEFEAKYGASIASLMTEGTVPIPVFGEDFRTEKVKARHKEEHDKGLRRPVVVR